MANPKENDDFTYKHQSGAEVTLRSTNVPSAVNASGLPRTHIIHTIITDGDGDGISIDAATRALETIDYAHHEIHSGSSFSVHNYDVDFDKSDELNVCFTTPNTTKWCHVVPLVSCTTKAVFELLEGPTISAGSGTTLVPTNRNFNYQGVKTSAVSNLEGTPAANSVQVNATISADGTQKHAEAFGAKKGKAQSGGVRDMDEYILKQNTTYAFRLKGTGTGDDNAMGSMEITWYEHTDKG